MTFHTTTHDLERARSHEAWLHDLCNMVSTASVATSVGRRLMRDDAASATEMLDEAERALALCRELLAAAPEHLRRDAPVEPPPSSSAPGPRRHDDPRATH